MASFVKSTCEYAKLRKNFGRQPLFQDVPAQMIDSIDPAKEEGKRYILRNPVHRYTQATQPQSQNETNTEQVKRHDQGVNHFEGGWPRDVHIYNEDHLLRHRRRVMHEDGYIKTVLNLTPTMLHYVDQNNAIEMYETYFSNTPKQKPMERCSIHIANVFRDPFKRPISCVKWTNESNPKLAAAYCFKSCMPNLEPKLSITDEFYLWDTHRQTSPVHRCQPVHSCWQLACSPVNPSVLITGLDDGTVHVFDIRAGMHAVSSSSVYSSHNNPITSLLYIQSRTHNEFFSGSPDGQCLWWDLRNISTPSDRLPLSIRLSPGQQPAPSNAEGVSTLEYDYGLPTKFLCGTESGLVINGNRMGRSHSEILVSYWSAHHGPVQAIQRSMCTLRMFLTCGDYTVKVWSEEVRTAPIIVTNPYRHLVTDAAWTPLRYSSYMSICAGGMFYYWDLLRNYKKPVATLQVSKHELTRLAPHSDGESVAVGDSAGCLHLLYLSENMTLPESREKILMTQLYSRETKREHILDNRLKEIRLKTRVEGNAPGPEARDDIHHEEDLYGETEVEYFRIVKEELRQIESIPGSTHTGSAHGPTE